MGHVETLVDPVRPLWTWLLKWFFYRSLIGNKTKDTKERAKPALSGVLSLHLP